MEIDFLNRNYLTVDWATLIFVITFATIVITRITFPNQFAEFIRLGFSNKYLKIYRDTNNM